MQNKTENKDKYKKDKFRYCTIDDFTKRGVKVEKQFEKYLTLRLCPNISASNLDYYKV